MLMLRRDGLGGAQDFCAFKSIEQADGGAYRVVQECADLRDPSSAETSTVTYVLNGDSAFTATSEYGWERSARFCAQADMPSDWRDIDLED